MAGSDHWQLPTFTPPSAMSWLAQFPDLPLAAPLQLQLPAAMPTFLHLRRRTSIINVVGSSRLA